MTADQWNVKRIDLLVELLHKMARVLNYDLIKRVLRILLIRHEYTGKQKNNKTPLEEDLLKFLKANGHYQCQSQLASQ